MAESRRFDVLTVTDCRLPGGTAASVAEELTAQRSAGWDSGLLHVDSPLVQKPRPFNPRLAEAVEDGTATLVVGAEPVEADLLVLRHPTVIAAIDPTTVPPIATRQVVVVANQAPGTPEGEPIHYDPTAVDAHVRAWLGDDVSVLWAPIGPLVRENLALIAPEVPQVDDDWVNIIDVAAWTVDRSQGITDTPVIGRHSRNSPHKWPADRETLLAAYPTEHVQVEVLGGASPAKEILGSLPKNWRVRPFGAVRPERFLADVDVFVYFHHPDWVEAFGRTILEALASGAPAVIPAHFAPVFGDACLYATPAEVAGLVAELAADRERYVAQSELGRRFVEERFGHGVHVARVAALLGTAAPTAATATPPTAGDDRPRVLFVSSNGAGVGHLMRLMSMARRAERITPMFLTLSQAISVVREQGFPVEYLASRQYTDAPVGRWHRLLRDRLTDLIDRHDLRAIVFDGTWPYRGLLEIGIERPHVHLIWSRRAMWRPGISNPMLHAAPRFSAILEPGEFANDADAGITTTLQDGAQRVNPITFLDRADQLDREQARAEMGLDPDRPAALVQLGAGNINDTSSLLGAVVAALTKDPDLQVCVTRSVIATGSGTLPDGVRTVAVYPLARYLQAFDLAVAASGYNTFHELVSTPVPTLFLPNEATSTDDQLGRARFAEQVGVGRCLREVTPESLEAALAPLLDPEARDRMRELALARVVDNGADAAIRTIEHIATSTTPPPEVASSPLRLPREAPPAPTPVPASLPTPSASTSTAVVPAPAAATPRSPAISVRRRIRKLGDTPRIRRAARAAYDRLPDDARQLVRGRLKGAGPSDPGAPTDRLPVPPGTLLPERERSELHGIAVLLDEDLDGDALWEVVDRIAGLQVVHRGFTPLFVTGSADAGAFRRFGYVFEYLPDATTWQRIGDEAARRDHVQHRIRDVLHRYEVRGVVAVTSVDDVDRQLLPLVT